MRRGVLAGLPLWREQVARFNRLDATPWVAPGPASPRVHAGWALALGLVLGIVVATGWWTTAVDDIVARRVAAQEGRR